jgi:phosphatidylglycerophosphate synthase
VEESRFKERVDASSRPDDGYAYTRIVNRRVAIHLTMVAWRTGLSPNQVTSISFIVTMAASIALLVPPHPKTVAPALAIWASLAFGYALDASDGQLARATGRTSLRGELLDHSLDAVKIVTLNIAIGLYLFATGAGATWAIAIVTWLSVTANSAHFFVTLFRDKALQVDIDRFGFGPAQRWTLRRLPLELADFGFFLLLFLLAVWPAVLFWCFALYAIYMAVFFVTHLGRMLSKVGVG